MPPKAKKKIVIPAKTKKNCYIKELIIALALLTAVVTPFIYNLESRSFHPDENHWIYTAKYFKLFFIDKDFNNQQWNEFWAYDQPSVGRYIIGLSLFLDGAGDRLQQIRTMPTWDFGRGFNWNVLNGALPQEDILYTARLPMAIMGGLTCFLIYLAGKMIFNRWTGIIAALLLAYNPLMQESCQRAMTDSPLIFFLTANMVLIIFFYRFLLKQKYYVALGFSLLIGIDIALATGTKLNGALAGFVFGTFCTILMVMKIRSFTKNENTTGLYRKIITSREIITVFSSLILSGLTAIILFTGLNPYLYKHPLKGYREMVEHRMDTVKGQQKNGDAITTISEKIGFVLNRTLYDEHCTTLKLIVRIPLDFIFFTGGLILLCHAEAKHLLDNYEPSLQSIIIIWTLITYLSIMVWIPLDWARYYLPPIPCVAVMIGYCIVTASRKICHLSMVALRT